MNPDLLEQGAERLRAASGPGYGRVVLPGQLDLAHGRTSAARRSCKAELTHRPIGNERSDRE